MRSIATSVQSLNWRTVWIGTFLFMGLYFVAFDNNKPLTPEQIQEIQKSIPIETAAPEMGGGASKHVSAPKKNDYDSRFDEQVHIEDPNPVLGEKYDSPLDAIPDRQRPIIQEKTKWEEEEKSMKAKAKTEKEKGESAAKTAGPEKTEKKKKKKPEKSGDVSKAAGPAKTEKKEPESAETTKPNKDKPETDTPKETQNEEISKGEESKGDKEEATKDKTKEDTPKEDKTKEDKPQETEETPNEGKTEDQNSKDDDSDVKESKKGPSTDDESKAQGDEAKTTDKAKDEPSLDEKLKAAVEESQDEKPDETLRMLVEASHPDSLEGMIEIDQNKKVPPEDYVAICIAVKDQADDLREFFIHHYNHIGIRRFYVMDDNSDPPLSETKDYGIPNEFITFDYQEKYHRWGGHREQMQIMRRCFRIWGDKHTWMAFIDVDEFIEMTAGNETLQDMLHEFEAHDDIGALAINWRMHTSSGHKTRPDSTRKAFIDCIWDGEDNDAGNDDNAHVKSIVRMTFAQDPMGPHTWYLTHGNTYGEHYDQEPKGLNAWRNPITRDRIALHHYAIKSREEYEAKMLRGNAMDDPKGEAFWNKLEHELPLVPCPEMAKYDP
ncbi:hypothetical protein LSUE1_G008863 [Lachnellula suecica]|uniref:Glycosyltransferase family 92 protein n=1 Tax=Lachnellula suecica TaxID=602035 RepID=A0A8T9CB68_9HELO|nr:hypothetical protein LSUE1_G008863 [Lachnellula suecica]